MCGHICSQERESFSFKVSTFAGCKTKQHSSSWMVSNFSVLNIYLSNKTFIRSIDRWSASQYKFERYNILITGHFFLRTISEKSPFYAATILVKQKKKEQILTYQEREKIRSNIFAWDVHYFLHFHDGFLRWRFWLESQPCILVL